MPEHPRPNEPKPACSNDTARPVQRLRFIRPNSLPRGSRSHPKDPTHTSPTTDRQSLHNPPPRFWISGLTARLHMTPRLSRAGPTTVSDSDENVSDSPSTLPPEHPKPTQALAKPRALPPPAHDLATQTPGRDKNCPARTTCTYITMSSELLSRFYRFRRSVNSPSSCCHF